MTVELCKSAALRPSASAPVRLGADETHLGFAWLLSIDDSVRQPLRGKRELYDEIAADVGGDWKALREQLGAGMLVDMSRLLVESEAPLAG